MPYNATVFRVMIASPSDVTVERNLIRDILAEWNAIHSSARKIVLLPVGWETHASPTMGERPQAVINKQVLKDCDLLVGVFWTRIGTSTGGYASGTVEEIEEHLKADKPAMLYFSSTPVALDSVNPDQYKQLQAFRDSCYKRGLVEGYASIDEFKDKFARQLQLKLNEDAFSTPESAVGGEHEIVETAVPRIPNLTAEARQLLLEAIKDPHGNIRFARHLGGVHLGTNGKEFITDREGRTRAIWEGALRELEQEFFIQDRGHKGEIYGVTREGYNVAALLSPPPLAPPKPKKPSPTQRTADDNFDYLRGEPSP